MYSHEKKVKPTQDEYYAIQSQFENTPHPDESYGATGEHFKLKVLLDKLGFWTKTTREAYFKADELLLNGYDYEQSSYQN